MVKVLIKKLNPEAKLPKYKTDGSSGMDLMAFVNEPMKVLPKKYHPYFLSCRVFQT